MRTFQAALTGIAAATLVFLSSCGHGSPFGGDSGADSGSGQPAEILNAGGSGTPLRIDLPGRMSVLVQVLDELGDPVSGLTNDNFELFEDGQVVSRTESQQQLLPRPRVFRSFSHLLLDLSGSVTQTPQGQQSEIDAALRFIELVTQAEENYLAISFFFGGQDIAPALLDDLTPLGFSNNATLLTEAVENVDLIQVTSTSTNLYGAILDGLGTLDDALISSQSVVEFQSLTLVTFTDGTDQAGLFALQDVTNFLDLSPNRYNLQAIGVGTEIDTQTLAGIGPNGWLLADNLDSLTETFGQVGNYVRDLANSFYLVGYISPKVHSTVQRTLRVQASRADSSASAEYVFTPEYFSGGAGFVEARQSSPSEGLASWVDLAVGPNETTLLLATRSGPGDVSQGIAVRSVRSDLTADLGFGQQGEVVLHNIHGFDFLTPVKIQRAQDDSIFVLLETRDHVADTDPHMVLAHWDSTGVWLGSVLIDDAAFLAEQARDLAIAQDNRVWVLSQWGVNPATRTVLRRYDPTTLALDGTFGNAGIKLITADGSGNWDDPQAMCVDGSGGVYYTGRGYNPVTADVDLMLVHVLESGTMDASFGTGGILMGQGTFAGAGPGIGFDVELGSDGNLVVAGQVTPLGSSVPRAAFWRVLGDGTPDTSFFGNATNPNFQTGLVALGSSLTSNPFTLFGVTSKATQLRIMADGSLFAAGTRLNARGDQDLCFWRLAGNGLFLPSYNFTGFMIEDGSVGLGSSEVLSNMRLFPDGSMLAAGTGSDGLLTAPMLWLDTDPVRSTPGN
ncbi:MAG: hypothetical protein ACI87O_003059 [Planctomycetota bacterium]|jgi:hypothetical protein